MNLDLTKRFAGRLDQAATQHLEVDRLTLEVPELSLIDAYRIQDHVVAKRVARGHTVIGYKMGLTSRAKMKQMNVHSPIFGALTSDMLITQIEMPHWIHPKIEPEVAFILKSDLVGAVTPQAAYAAVESVFPAMELIDSRYRDFKFQLPDVIADNCSSAGIVIPPPEARTPAGKISFEALGNLGMIFSSAPSGSEAYASSSAIFGHPAASLAELSRLLGESGRHLKAGMLILAGGATEAVMIEPDKTYSCEIQGLGKTSIKS
jgi:2-oxo-3-hexenedioate decarboxylase